MILLGEHSLEERLDDIHFTVERLDKPPALVLDFQLTVDEQLLAALARHRVGLHALVTPIGELQLCKESLPQFRDKELQVLNSLLPSDILRRAAFRVLHNSLELRPLVLFVAVLYLFVGEHDENRLAVLTEVVAVAGHRPFHFKDNLRGVLPYRGGAVGVHTGYLAERDSLVLDNAPITVLVAELDMSVGCVGVEERHGLLPDLAGIADRHRCHIPVLVKQRVQFIAEHRGEVATAEFCRGIEAVQVVRLLCCVPKRHDLTAREQHIAAFDVHAVNAVAVEDCFEVLRDFRLCVILGLVDALHGYPADEFRHSLRGEPLQVVGYACHAVDSPVIVHDIGVQVLLHHRVFLWVVLTAKPLCPEPRRDDDRLFFQRGNLFRRRQLGRTEDFFDC